MVVGQAVSADCAFLGLAGETKAVERPVNLGPAEVFCDSDLTPEGAIILGPAQPFKIFNTFYYGRLVSQELGHHGGVFSRECAHQGGETLEPGENISDWLPLFFLLWSLSNISWVLLQ